MTEVSITPSILSPMSNAFPEVTIKGDIKPKRSGTLNPDDLEYLKQLMLEASPHLAEKQLDPSSDIDMDYITEKIKERLGDFDSTEQKNFALTLKKLQERLGKELNANETTKPSTVKPTSKDNESNSSLLPLPAGLTSLSPALSPYPSPLLYNNFSDATKETLKKIIDKEKFVAFSWCSWCFECTIHGRLQRNILRRSRYKCTNCAQVTLKCQSGCGAMARGHSDYDEYLCANCDGTLTKWGETRPSKQGHCSHCLKHTTHNLMNKGFLLQSTYQCQFCKTNTFLCTHCEEAFGVFESNLALLNELIHFDCIKCAGEIDNWPEQGENLTLPNPDNHISRTISPKPTYKDPFESFAPSRKGNKCEALVDGKDFFAKAYDYINGATQTIFISAWWLAPFIYLKREKPPFSKSHRLDHLLWTKANQGVKIYVLLWSNSMFISLCSDQAADWIDRMNHPNIYMMRHPLFTLPNFFWSHHQKFLCIDYTKAILGGLDFTVGRYDNFEHRLTDLGQNSLALKDENGEPTEIESKLSNLELSDKVPIEPEFPIKYGDNGSDESITTSLLSFFGTSEALEKEKIHKESDNHIWPGIDYYQPQSARPENYQNFKKDIIERKYTSRMPWHDISVAVEGYCAYDTCINFVERWNHHRDQFGSDHLPIIKLPGPPSEFENFEQDDEYSCQCQVVRSLSEWSGLQSRTKEASVYGAYLATISNAEHYIYIENQYVVSSTAGGGVENQIVQAIVNRVICAIENNRTFRVFIVFPIPEEQGAPANHMLQLSYQTLFRGGFSLMDQIRLSHPEVDPFEYVGFYFLRNHDKLYKKPEDPGYFSLDKKPIDNDQELEMVAITDMVFIHSKLLIVDDKVAIIASNNLNDRSMLGDRDSELGMVIADQNKVNIQMDGQDFAAGKFAFDLRMKLWREHLGLMGDEFDSHEWVQQLRDPISSASYHGIFRKVAALNTDIYTRVFPHIPSNKFTKLAQWEEFNSKVQSGKVETAIHTSLLDQVQGHLCYHPTKFVSADNMDWTLLEDMLGNELVS